MKSARVVLSAYLVICAVLVLGPLPVAASQFTGMDVHVRRTFVEGACNVAMFVPIGALVPRALAWSGRRTVMLCLWCSLSVEMLQAVVLNGRFATGRDVLLNVLGAATGVLCGRSGVVAGQVRSADRPRRRR
jgi:VanZ family protein